MAVENNDFGRIIQLTELQKWKRTENRRITQVQFKLFFGNNGTILHLRIEKNCITTFHGDRTELYRTDNINTNL